MNILYVRHYVDIVLLSTLGTIKSGQACTGTSAAANIIVNLLVSWKHNYFLRYYYYTRRTSTFSDRKIGVKAVRFCTCVLVLDVFKSVYFVSKT